MEWWREAVVFVHLPCSGFEVCRHYSVRHGGPDSWSCRINWIGFVYFLKCSESCSQLWILPFVPEGEQSFSSFFSSIYSIIDNETPVNIFTKHPFSETLKLILRFLRAESNVCRIEAMLVLPAYTELQLTFYNCILS